MKWAMVLTVPIILALNPLWMALLLLTAFIQYQKGGTGAVLVSMAQYYLIVEAWAWAKILLGRKH